MNNEITFFNYWITENISKSNFVIVLLNFLLKYVIYIHLFIIDRFKIKILNTSFDFCSFVNVIFTRNSFYCIMYAFLILPGHIIYIIFYKNISPKMHEKIENAFSKKYFFSFSWDPSFYILPDQYCDFI